MSHPAVIKLEEFKDLKLLKSAFTYLGYKVTEDKSVRLYNESRVCDAVAKKEKCNWDIGLAKTEEGPINLIYDDMADLTLLKNSTGPFGRLKQMYSCYEQVEAHEAMGETVIFTEEKNAQGDVELLMEMAK